MVMYRAWSKRSLKGKHYVYIWAGGVHFNIRLGEKDRLCILVVIGATADGTKELIAIQEGYRESEQSWKTLLLATFAGKDVGTDIAVTNPQLTGPKAKDYVAAFNLPSLSATITPAPLTVTGITADNKGRASLPRAVAALEQAAARLDGEEKDKLEGNRIGRQ